MSVLDHLSDGTKHLVDGGAALTALAAFFSILPQATALLGFIWFALRIFESYQNIRLNGRKLRGRE